MKVLNQKPVESFEKKEVDCAALNKMLESGILEGKYSNSYLKKLTKGYNKLSQHNVSNLYFIKEVHYEDNIYVVYAMPMKSATLTEDEVNNIKTKADEQLSVGGIRYGSRELGWGFGVHDFDINGKSTISKPSEMDAFSDQFDGIIILSYMVMSKNKRNNLACSAAAYGFGKPQLIGKNGMWIAAIQNSNL